MPAAPYTVTSVQAPSRSTRASSSRRNASSRARPTSGESSLRAEGVVLVDVRDAEDGHDGVADELLHCAAVALDRSAHGLVPPAHQAAQRLGIEALAELRRLGEVAEQDGDGLPRGCGRGHPDSV